MQAINAALEGLQRAQEMLEVSAHQIASQPGRLPDATRGEPAPDVADLSSAVVGLLEARNVYTANVRVLDTTLDLQESLLDVLG